MHFCTKKKIIITFSWVRSSLCRSEQGISMRGRGSSLICFFIQRGTNNYDTSLEETAALQNNKAGNLTKKQANVFPTSIVLGNTA